MITFTRAKVKRNMMIIIERKCRGKGSVESMEAHLCIILRHTESGSMEIVSAGLRPLHW